MQSALAILGLRDTHFDAEQLRAAYRRALLNAHPDRGGTDEAFRTLAKAYKFMRKYLQESGAPAAEHHDLRRDARANGSAASGSSSSYGPGAFGGDGRMDNVAFNRAFDREHLARPVGHGEWLSADVPAERVCPERVSEKEFDRAFAQVARRNTLSLIVRTPPVVMSAQCSLAAGNVRGDEQADDFSGAASRGLLYTDLRVAHDQQIIDRDEAEAFARAREGELLGRLKTHQRGVPAARTARLGSVR